MRFSLVHGPNRYELGKMTGMLVPFYGIVSRGLLNLISEDSHRASEWSQVAPRLDNASAFWRDAVTSCKVLNYTQSATCAKRFLMEHGVTMLRAVAPDLQGEAREWELWSVKEGHTASIWCATAFLGPSREPLRFCLNIARDAAANEELDSTTRTLQALARRHPEAVVQILGAKRVPIKNEGRDWEVAVVATNWVQGWELHALPMAASAGRLVAVARFLCSEAEPGLITRIAGFDTDSTETWRRILFHWIQLADWSRAEGPVLLPAYEINEGDWMLTEDSTVLCAVSAGELLIDPALAVWACILLHARQGSAGARLYWGNVEHAIIVLRESLSPGRPALAAGLALASTVSIEELRRTAITTDEAGEALWEKARRYLAGTSEEV